MCEVRVTVNNTPAFMHATFQGLPILNDWKITPEGVIIKNNTLVDYSRVRNMCMGLLTHKFTITYLNVVAVITSVVPIRDLLDIPITDILD